MISCERILLWFGEIGAYIPAIQRSLCSWVTQTKALTGLPCGPWFLCYRLWKEGANRGVGQVSQKVILVPLGPSRDFLQHQPYLIHIVAAQGTLGSACQALAFLKWRERQ